MNNRRTRGLHSIKDSAAAYKQVKDSLNEIRPWLHVASALTTISFAVFWLTGRPSVQWFVQECPIAAYTVAVVIAVFVGYKYEKKLSAVIDSFGIALADFRSMAIVGLLTVIAVPLIIVGASTSFFGGQETANSISDKSEISNVAKVATTFKQDLQQTKQANRQEVKDLKQERKDAKWQVDQQFADKISAVVPAAKKRYPDRSEDWQRAKYKQYVDSEKSKLRAAKSSALAEFDAETNALLQTLRATHDRAESDIRNNDAVIIAGAAEQSATAQDRIKMFGNFLGLIGLASVIISLFCSIAVHTIEKGLTGTVQPTKKKKGTSLSPTLLAKNLLKGTKKTQNRGGGGVNSPKNSGRGVVERSKPAEIDRFEQPQQQPVFEFDVPQNHRNKGNKSGLTGLKQQILDQYAICNDASRSSQERADASELMNELTEQLNESGQGIDFDDKDRISFSELTLF